jgi:hypothetical protein
MDHLLSVGVGELLDVRTFWLRELMGQPEDLGQGVCLLLDRFAGCVVFSPHGDYHERQQHSVDHAQGRLDETGHVVVGLARFSGNEALHQLEAGQRDEANRPDHEYAIN